MFPFMIGEAIMTKSIFGAVDEAFEEGYKNLGRVVYHFQQVEEILGWAVCFLIQPDTSDLTMSKIIVCEQSFKQLVGLAHSLFELFPESEDKKTSKEWRSILGLALQAERERNQILHSVFGVSTAGEPVFFRSKETAKYRKGFHVLHEKLSTERRDIYFILVGKARREIERFMGDIFPGWEKGQWKPKAKP